MLRKTALVIIVALALAGTGTAFGLHYRCTPDQAECNEGIFFAPISMAANEKNIFVASYQNIRIFDLNGTYVDSIGTWGSGNDELNNVKGIAVNDNRIFISNAGNNRVQIFDLNGTYIGSIGTKFTSGTHIDKYGARGERLDNNDFSWPAKIAINDNYIFVVEEYFNQVKIFDLDGTYVNKFKTLNWAYGDPLGIAANATHVFVADGWRGTADIFDLNGTHVGNVGGESDAFEPCMNTQLDDSGKIRTCSIDQRYRFNSPTDIAVSDNNIFVSASPDTIYVFKLDGTYVSKSDSCGAYDGHLGDSMETTYLQLNVRGAAGITSMIVVEPMAVVVSGKNVFIANEHDDKSAIFGPDCDVNRLVLDEIGVDSAAVRQQEQKLTVMPAAEAEPIPSPYRQARDGVPIGEIVCAGDRMLMLSPSGMPACVFAGSVEVLERRGFVLLSEVPRDDLSAKQPGASEKAGGTGSPDASKTGDRPFVTTWRTASPNESITIPVGGSTGAYTVDWGDGTVTSVTGDASHAYANPGVHQVVISGDFTRIYLNGSPNAEKLQSIDQWGDIQWESMNSAFGRATNMVYRATDVPDLSGVTDMSAMFGSATSFNGDISPWDVSGVADMSWMFSGADSFNGDISEWDVSGVTDMSAMFADADSFNGDISEWDVSSVTAMSAMFADADSFNGDVSPWDVSGVTDMSAMFADAGSFNGDISEWNVSQVTYMHSMFSDATSFNQDLNDWDVSKVTGMFEMFLDADSFTQNLGSWYITLDDTSINDGDATRTVGNISAQNSFLSGRNPTYGIGLGGDSELFVLDGTSLKLKAIQNHLTKSSYTVNITSTGTFGTNNFRIFDIAVSEGAAVSPLDSYASNPPTAYADFITAWKTTQPGEAVTIPVGSSTGAYTVDWGDGTVTSVTGDASHAYASPGEYRVVISGDFTRIYLSGSPNAEKLQ